MFKVGDKSESVTADRDGAEAESYRRRPFMSKRSIQVQETMYCGIDVSAKSLTVAIQRVHQPVEQRSFPNTSVGTGLLSAGCGKQITGSSVVGSNGNLLSGSRVCT